MPLLIRNVILTPLTSSHKTYSLLTNVLKSWTSTESVLACWSILQHRERLQNNFLNTCWTQDYTCQLYHKAHTQLCTLGTQFSFHNAEKIESHTFSGVLPVEDIPERALLSMNSWTSSKSQHQNFIRTLIKKVFCILIFNYLSSFLWMWQYMYSKRLTGYQITSKQHNWL